MHHAGGDRGVVLLALPYCFRLQIYLAILTVRVLLSWFRNIDWFSEPWNTLRQVRSGWQPATQETMELRDVQVTGEGVQEIICASDAKTENMQMHCQSAA